jgi:Domain of unknown function (DUF4082)/Bacterial Ig-like domain/Bacterial Ig domain
MFSTSLIRRLHARRFVAVAVALGALLALIHPRPAAAAPGAPCQAPVDVVACENTKPGTPQSTWDISGQGDPSIQGFATRMSIDHGQSIDFKIKTDASAYRIDIYRVGYYQGNGARLVDSITPSASLPQTQPACLQDNTSGLYDCGNWSVSATWNSPADAVSGVYFARLVRTDTGGASQILFVVRDDERHADMVVQTSDETWQAYNSYGNVALYDGLSTATWWNGRAFKVSYNRPLIMRETQPYSSFFNAEYPMVRWLERNGYDVSYLAGIDTARRPAELLQHKVFISSGHDEYWSAEQRANVEAARDAGVSLAFFSGNEMFWKTRWEPTIDGSGTADRTLVTYKESNNNTRTDPTGIWTGSWRDTRFSPPADGGRPENGLTGTLFMVNAYRNDPITVPAKMGKARFWRNTSIANLAPGDAATLPAGVLGYEWDVDADNGSRPAGLFDLSSTTMNLDTQFLLNQGTVFGAGTATHSLTLYRASSGALVFGAGTVQWAWGLDGRHDNDNTSPTQDPRMQQATANLFADMGVQPATLQANLVAATASTDGDAPTATISTPDAGSTFTRRDTVTITGTAADTGGGIVAGVEVSVDGGATWHPAKGTDNWSYTWNVSGYGPVVLKARATDDSGNIGVAAGRSVSVICPCSIWSDATTPAATAQSDPQAYELGVKFRADVSGYVTGVRFYKGAGNGGTHLGHLWDSAGNKLGEVMFTSETATGWQQALFSKPIPVAAGTTYIASYYAPQGNYALDRPYFTTAVANSPLRALADGEDGAQAVFKAGASGFPTTSKQSSNYWVDVVFNQDGTDRVGPGVLSTRPTDGNQSAPLSANITAQFDEDLDPASVNGTTFELRDANGNKVAATVSYDGASRTAILDPAASLNLNSNYTAKLVSGASGVKDTSGNPLSADRTWSFKTFSCPCSLWPDTAVPSDTSNWDTGAYELGVKLRSEVNGYITGVRFYKGAGNSGTHLGHLWTSTGTRLGEVVFTNETATGWQTAKFSSPIAVNANQTYIVSYYDPNGHYALDRPYFSTDRSSGPLRALADGEEGGNGVFKSGASGFPTTSKSASNYWVDAVFSQDGVDRIGPGVLSTTPAANVTNAPITTDFTARMDEALDPSSVNGTNVQVTTGAGDPVPATVSYDAPNTSIVIHPSATLNVGTTYRVTLRSGASGVRDVAGNPITADYTWSFSTYSCPCTLWSNATTPSQPSYPDSVSYELGVKFRSELNGFVTGIRFYKGTGNGGTHLGHLWDAAGNRLGEVTFTNETATGWQQANFATPIPITAGQTYVASYYAPQGNYALDRPYFSNALISGPLRALSDTEATGNGVFKSGTSGFPNKAKSASNYWVDLVFATN